MSKLGLWDKFPPGYLPNWLEDSAWNSKATGLYPHEGSSTQWEDVLKQLKDFSPDYRAILVSVIEQQSQGALSEIQAQSLQLLAQNNTFTVTTGQQIHFDLGPSYVFYKIVSAISLAQELAQKFPDSNFVPVFWMATEDHDFKEISQSVVFNNTYVWEAESYEGAGPVGRKSVIGLKPWLDWITSFFNNNSKSTAEIEIVTQIFTKPNQTLAAAIQQWVLWIFRDTSLLVLNPDEGRLKRAMIPTFIKEITPNGGIYSSVELQNLELKQQSLSPEAHVRECNLFYMNSELRERLEASKEHAIGMISGKKWTTAEIITEIEHYPERFSPNVLLRPIYQQTILPNIAYIAGPSEYKYWLQLPKALSTQKVAIPALILRKSGVFLSKSNEKKLNKWGFSLWDLFTLNEDEIRSKIFDKVDADYTMAPSLNILEEQLQVINSTLYRWNSADLKNIKLQGEQLLKALKSIEKVEQEKAVNNLLSKAEWSALNQLKQSTANPKAPQERQHRWIQELLNDPNSFYQYIQLFYQFTENSVDPTTAVEQRTKLQYFKEPFIVFC